MRNLKKFLAVLVVVAMMASLMITASAAVPSDVKGTDYETAVVRLSALGIFTGYPDGTFGPNDTITRAQFAAVVVRSLGLESAANAASTTTKFSDVAAAYWAAGYIKIATDLGVIKGYPDGRFGPEDKVTYEQAVAMVMRALGYEPAALANGGYPSGHLAVAADQDVTDDVEGSIGAPAPRGLVALLVDNALEVPLMVQVGFGTDTKYVISGEENNDDGVKLQTLIGKKLGLTQEEDATVVSVDGQEIEVDIPDSGIQTYEVFEGISTVGLEDSIIDFWEKDDVIYAISIDSTTYYDFIDEIDGTDDTDELNVNPQNIAKFKFLNSGSTFRTHATDGVVDYTINLNDGSAGNDADILLGAFVKVIVADKRVVSVQAFNTATKGIITDITEDVVTYTEGDATGKKIRGLEDADSLIVVIDGAAASLSDLKEDMLLDAWTKSNGKEFALVASTKVAEGELTEVDVDGDDKVYIDDEEYDLNDKSYFSEDEGGEYKRITTDADLDDMLGIDVVAYLNAKGDVAYIKGDADSTESEFYGVVLRAWSTDVDNLRIFKEVEGEGKSVNYATDLDTTSQGIFDDLAATGSTPGSIAYLRTNSPEELVFEFTVNSDGEITKIVPADYTAGNGYGPLTLTEFDEDADAMKVNTTRYYVAGAPIFDVEEPDDPSLALWNDIKEKEPPAGANEVYFGDYDKKAGVVVFTDGFDQIVEDDVFVAFVTKKAKASSDDYKLTLANATETFDKLIDKSEAGSVSKNQFLVYKNDGADAVKYSSSYSWNENAGQSIVTTTGWSVVTDVYDVDSKNGFIQLTYQGDWLKVASDVVVYEVTKGAKDYLEASVSDIVDVVETENVTEGDKVQLYVDDGVIKAIFFQKDANEKP